MKKILLLLLILLVSTGCAPRLSIEGQEPPLSEGVRTIELDDETMKKLQLKKDDLLLGFGAEGTIILYTSNGQKFKNGRSFPWFPGLKGIDVLRDAKTKIKRFEGSPTCWYIQSGRLKPKYYPNPPCPPY